MPFQVRILVDGDAHNVFVKAAKKIIAFLVFKKVHEHNYKSRAYFYIVQQLCTNDV